MRDFAIIIVCLAVGLLAYWTDIRLDNLQRDINSIVAPCPDENKIMMYGRCVHVDNLNNNNY